MAGGQVSVDLVALIAGLAGLTVPPRDCPAIAVVLESLLAGATALWDLDLTDVDPVVSFEPDWR